jgi:hypothetical protein
VSDIFQEVEEDVRRERYEQLWKRYGTHMMVAAGILVVGVASFQAWRTYELNQRQAISDRFTEATKAVQAGDAAKAETEFTSLAGEAPAGYATLAKFNLAAALLAQGKRDPSIALLRELMAESDPIIASSARLRLAWIEADAKPKAEIVVLLEPLTAADNPWRFTAGEVLAYVDLKDGARAQAQEAYQKLAQDLAAPANLRQRAAGIAEYLKANPDRGVGSVAPIPAAPPPAAASSAPPGTKQ